MWTSYTKNGQRVPIPADAVVFWGELVSSLLVSCVETTAIMWCFPSGNLCLGATVLDSELWEQEHGATISGQWRVIENGRLTLLKPLDRELLPKNPLPQWMQKRVMT